MTQETKRFDLVDRLMRYDEGELSEQEYLELFQYLVDTGMAWTLQGSIGREAMRLLKAGLITEPESEGAK